MRFLAILSLLILTLAGCGGGTGSPGGGQTTVVTVPAAAASQQAIGATTFLFDAFTFPVDTSVPLTNYSNDWPITNRQAQTISNGVGISVPSPAQKDVRVTIPVPSNLASDSQLAMVAKTNNPTEPWQLLEFQQTGQTITATIPHDQLGQTRSIGNLITGALGLVFFDHSPPADPAQMRLEYVAGSGAMGDNTLVLVHGLADNWQDMIDLGRAAVAAHLFRNAYALSYDWRLPGEVVAAFLHNQLGLIASNGHVKGTTLLGHSYGGDICRYTLEPLKATAAVRNNICVCSPLGGTESAKLGSLVSHLVTHQLNTPYTDGAGWHGLIALNSPAVQSLNPSSSFISTMRQPLYDQRGSTNYLLIGGDSDPFVDWTNAEQIGTDLEAFTGGYISRITEHTDHSSLIRTPSGINALVSDIRNFLGQTTSGVGVTFQPSSQVAESHNPLMGDGWDWQFVAQNNTNHTIRLDSFPLSKYDLYGAWIGTWWFDPNTSGGQLFPSDPTPWGVSLAPNQTITVSIHTFVDTGNAWLPIDQAQERLRAQQVVCSLLWSDGQGQHRTEATLINYYGSYWPAAANTRATHGPTIGVGFALIK